MTILAVMETFSFILQGRFLAVLGRRRIAVTNVVDFDATSVSSLRACAVGMSRNPTTTSSQSRRFVSSLLEELGAMRQ